MLVSMYVQEDNSVLKTLSLCIHVCIALLLLIFQVNNIFKMESFVLHNYYIKSYENENKL